MADIMLRIIKKFDRTAPSQRSDQPATPVHYAIEHSGWASVGWSDDDPTADEAIAALASLSKVDFPSAMESLRKSGETSLQRLRED